MAIFKPRPGEVDSFHITQDLNVSTNGQSRINNRVEVKPDRFSTYANVLAGRTPDGKQKLTGSPSAKELREARMEKVNNEENRRKSARSKTA